MKQLKKSYLTVALALSTCGVLFQNCAAAPPPDLGSVTSASLSVGSLTCSFAGQILTEGQTVSAYQASSVASGGVCVSQARTCTNGMLSGTYQFGGCYVESPTATASCSFYGQTIPHGQAVTAYQTGSVVGGACASENRICTNGVLAGTYQYTSCVVDCSFNGAVVAHATGVTAFAAASVPAGSACVSEVRSCNMGALSGSHGFSSCTVQSGGGTASCSFNGATVLHGASVTAYAIDEASYGTTCAAYSQQRQCNNGVLSGSYAYSSCFKNFDPCGGGGGYKSYPTPITYCP